MIEKSFVIQNEVGLHARPAAKLTQVASNFKSEILLVKDTKTANAKSLLSVLALGIFRDAEFRIRIIGPDELEAMCKITRLIEDDININ
ncbi:MAG: HPr family phosphocarrier protein [Xylanivirga thermophila]|jgi:phosphocarrier protein HPr|uniref:HPr family phosphocarrier protein n=1 Tax=Xylanivirga thermophila TaxID=2496273 RepID=UPI00101CA57C|nr:HPr family phosphocarrier protein [Xylanivirga thermophila]